MTKHLKMGLKIILILGFLLSIQSVFAKPAKSNKKAKKPAAAATKVETVAVPKDTIIVQLTKGTVTTKDMEFKVSKLHPMYQSRYKTVEGQKQVVEAILQEELFYTEALEQNYQNKPEVLEAIKTAQKPIINEKFYQKEIVDKVKIDDKEINQYYINNKSKFAIPPTIKIRHLQVQTQEEADQVTSLIDKDENFEELIAQHSTNKYSKEKKGIIENIRHNGYITGVGRDEALDNLIFSATTNGKIESIQSETGFHFIQKLEHIDEQVKELDTVKKDIVSQLKMNKERELYDTLIDKLLKDYNIVINNDYIKVTDFLSIHPDEFNNIVINSSIPELVYDAKRTFFLLKNRFQMERMNVENPETRKLAIKDDLNGSLVYYYALSKGFDKTISSDLEMINSAKAVIVRMVYQAEVIDQATISDSEIAEYYNAHKDAYKERAYREIRQFTFQTEKQANKTRKKAAKLIKKGNEEKIINLLRKESNNTDKDGLLTPIYNNGIVPTYGNDVEYNKMAIEINEKEVSPIFKNNRGEYVFFYLVRITEEKQKPLEEVKLSIQSNAQRRKATEIFKAKLEEYRAKYVVSEHYDLLKTKVTANELFDFAEDAQKKNSYRDAVIYYDQIIKEFTNGVDDYKAWFMKAFIFSENMNNKDEAIKLYKEMLTKWPNGELNDSASYMIDHITNGEDDTFILSE
ncbi:MAG TPA: peptidyl-prolyl cis-trans isomerase [Candidatus Cloacimonadota bacterium]|nr:peptidyl-prolyl cis-trans isomerase [Candidatus Cloacimonadota bacterium]HQB40197.1 peptidyl-prolyl cis-trans isomerase [Candidatus Cloacimonadota bacterium]